MNEKWLEPSTGMELAPFKGGGDERFAARNPRRSRWTSFKALAISKLAVEFGVAAAAVTGGNYYNGTTGMIGAALLCVTAKMWLTLNHHKKIFDCEEGWRLLYTEGGTTIFVPAPFPGAGDPNSGKKTLFALAAVFSVLSLAGGVVSFFTPNQALARYDDAKIIGRQAAACEIFKGKDKVEVKTPFFTQIARWGHQKKIADVEVSMEVSRRDGSAFTAQVKVNGFDTGAEMYIPSGNQFPGYDHATWVSCPPSLHALNR